MSASETHSSASFDKSGFDDGMMADSMVTNKLGMLMWPTNQIHKGTFVDQVSTMEQRPHANPVLAANGHMQHGWFRSNVK